MIKFGNYYFKASLVTMIYWDQDADGRYVIHVCFNDSCKREIHMVAKSVDDARTLIGNMANRIRMRTNG